MKKLSILLILVMIMSLIPALNVSAADYSLNGIEEGAIVVLQKEPTKTVTLADSTDVKKVIFWFNDEEPATATGPSFFYTMEFTSIGTQTLRYEVFKKGNNTNSPDASETITFNLVSGKLNEMSFSEDFDNPDIEYTVDNIKKIFVGNDGANISGRLKLSVVPWKGSNALQISGDGQSKSAHLQFKSTPSKSGIGLHFYEFDITLATAYNINLQVTADGYSTTTNSHILFNNKNSDVGIGTSSVIESSAVTKIGLVLNYNSTPPTATVYKNGVFWRNIALTKLANGTEDPVVTLYYQTHSNTAPAYIDNFSYATYDLAESQDFTKVSIEGGETPVSTDFNELRFTGAGYLEDQNVEDFVTISEKPNDGSADFSASSVTYSAEIEGNDVVLHFGQALGEAKTYKIDIIGLKDDYMMEYNNPSFVFRTLNPGENPLPVVSLIAPEEGVRYYPAESDIVELKAEAVDSLRGEVEYVEFYADGILIEGSRVTKEAAVDDVFTFNWTLDGSIDRVEPVAITAKAVDNEGGEMTSAARNIILRSKELPEVTIKAPEMDTLYYSNINGVDFEVKPTVKFTKSDSDGTIEAINVYVDGEMNNIDKNATEYTITEALGVGEHTIIVEVYDNDSQRAQDVVTVSVVALGKSGYIFNENYAEKDLIAQWKKADVADFANGTLTDYDEVKGAILSGVGTVKHTIIRNLEGTEFVADVKVAFNDTTTKRTVKLGSAELATFTAGGKITYGGAQKGEYQAGELYNISAVVNPTDGKVYAIVNGASVGSVAATYTINPQIVVSSEGAGEMAIITASASAVGLAVEPTVSIDGNKITVAFAAGVDTATLDGNVSLVDSNGNAANLVYGNGVFTVNEVLKYTETYKVVVLPDVRDLNGNSYNGTYEVPFTVPEPEVAVAEVSGEIVDDTAFLAVDFTGAAEAKTVTLVCAAYKDNKMVAYDTYEMNTSVAESDIELDLSGIVEGAVVEAFVIDDTLNTVTDKIIVFE